MKFEAYTPTSTIVVPVNISPHSPEAAVPTATSTHSSAVVLELNAAVKHYGSHTAVNNLSFSLHTGEVLALLGPNGAGKTTTVEMCEGFVRPDSGNVRVFGMDPAKQPDAVRARIGVMLQGGGAYPGIRVGEMLELVASYTQNPLDTQWLLETVGLTQYAKTPYRRLSGGQQQRLSLACALVGRPELVFLDEPTAGLDAQSRMMVWDLVRSLRRDGVAVVLTTHLMDEAEALADRVLIIDKGQLVAQGTPTELTVIRGHHPDNSTGATPAAGMDTVAPSTGMVTIHVNQPLDKDAVRAHVSAILDDGQNCAVLETKPQCFTIQVPSATPEVIAAIAHAAAQQQVLITQLDVNKQSLEDVFLAITGREIR